MRIGLSINADPSLGRRAIGDLATGAHAAEEAGLSALWVAHTPRGFDALTLVSVIGQSTSRIEVGTAVLPIQSRHPVLMAQQAISVQAVCQGRFTLGIGVSHHWIVGEMLGLPYERPAAHMRAYLEVLQAALRNPRHLDVENDFYQVHNPLDLDDDPPTPILLAALAPKMLRLAGGHAQGTILYMADERAVSEHIGPRITEAAAEAGRPAPRVVAGLPVALCRPREIDDVRRAVTARYGYVESAPNYQRVLSLGAADGAADILVAGEEEVLAERLGRYRDAGVTDLNAIIVPVGSSDTERQASKRRTVSFLASLVGEL